MDTGKLLISFQGRLNRQLFFLTHMTLSSVYGYVWGLIYLVSWLFFGIALLGGDEEVAAAATAGGFVILAVFSALLSIPFIWMYFSLYVKRAHDIGWTGWMVLLLFIPIVGLIFWILLLFKPGTHGENRYGPDLLTARANHNIERAA